MWFSLRHSFDKSLLCSPGSQKIQKGVRHHLCSHDASDFIAELRHLPKRIYDNKDKMYPFGEEEKLTLSKESV